MTVNPAAWLSIAGLRITTDTVTATAPVALSDLRVNWGRPDLFAQPDPATAQVTLFDPTGTWGTRLDSRGEADPLGDTALIGWTYAGTDRVLFRGRVDSIEVEPGRVGGIDGAFVHLGLVAQLTELASRTSFTVWPNERQGDRFTRLVGFAGASLIATAETPTSIGTLMRGREIQTRNLLQGLYDVFTLSAQAMTYLPDTMTLRGITRRYFPGSRGLVGIARDGTRVGAYLTTRTHQVYDKPAGQSTTSMAVEATGTPAATRSRTQRATTFTQNSWVYSGTLNGTTGLPTSGGYSSRAQSVTIARGFAAASELTIDTEAAVESGVVTPVTAAATSYSQIAAAEGAAPVPDPFTLDLRHTGGFADFTQALELLAGGESYSPVFVPATAFPRLGIRPVFAIVGGVIAHTDGRWLLTLQPAPVATDTKQHAITWAEIDAAAAAAVTWGTPRTNYAKNPRVAVDTTFWTTTAGTTAARIATGGPSDGPFYRLTATSVIAGGRIQVQNTSADRAPTAAGEVWTFSYDLRLSRAQGARVNASWENATGTAANITGPTVNVPANTWTRVSATFTMPTGAVKVASNLSAPVGTVIGETWDLTNALFEKSGTAGTFFDGAVPGTAVTGAEQVGDTSYAWTGTANASTSTRQAVTAVTAQTNAVRLYLDEDDHADGLHSSVTCEDLNYCSTGLDVTTPGPDTGWDTLQ